MKHALRILTVAIAWLVVTPAVEAVPLRLELDETAGTILVFRAGSEAPILTQNARADFRPFIHPLVAPDGNGVMTEFSPAHHKHQTGIYWGFTRVNGRDYFRHPGGGYWRRVAAKILQAESAGVEGAVRWQTVYDLLDERGEAVLTETQTWAMQERAGEYVLDLEWVGEGRTDVTIGEYDYGGLFLRMPWRQGIRGAVVNAARQSGGLAEGQRAPWLDVGMRVEGRDDLAHIAIFDHPSNDGFPQPWRVDGQLGVGPVRARLGDWHIAKGKKATIRHRLLVYTGELSDLSLTEKWSHYTGKRHTASLWRLAQREARQAEFLTPEEAVAAMTVQDGFQVNLYASEPMITQPMAFCWDDRGRFWIAENRDYESRGRGFANSGDSRIVILEDTDRDGVADLRKVFSQGIPFPSGIAVGLDGVWLAAPPNLLFLPDRDGDDRADADATEVRLTGWGIRDRHETINSLHWGPDGWLYGCQGFATPSTVGKPVGKGRLLKHKDPFPRDAKIEDPVEINGGVWRYHPTKGRFEVVAHGFSNPWGIDYDAKGQLFISACVIPHLWHIIPGGIYHRQGGKHFNPYFYSDIQTITDHRHRSAHGGARVYLSDAFPERYHGRLFMANIHEHAVLTDILERRGSGFVGRHGDEFLLANNAQWVGFSVEIGPEGAVYILDWHDGDICGSSVLNKETGRIFRITPTESRAKNWNGRYADLGRLTNQELVELQLSESAWHARRARLILQGRAAKGAVGTETHDALKKMFATPSEWRLRALWALHVTGGLEDRDLLGALKDGDEYVRAWAIQLLCEDLKPSDQALEKFSAMARTDPSPVVRLYLAAALQRMDPQKRWPIAQGLVEHLEDAEDHNIPKMLWFGIEPVVPRDPSLALELAARSRITILTRYIGRRLAEANHFDAVVRAIDAALDTDPEVSVVLLQGLRDGLERRSNVNAPENWAATYARLKVASNADVPRLALDVAQQFGDVTAVKSGLQTLQDEHADVEERRRELRTLGKQQFPGLPPVLLKLLDDTALRRDAIRAMAAFDREELSEVLLERYAEFSAEEKLEVVHTLASRSGSGWKLAIAIKRGDMPRRDVPPYVARQLRRVVGSGFVEIWGPIDAVSEEQEAAFVKYRALLTDKNLESADPGRGRAVFQRTCGACHKMYGEGGLIGPDITGSNRTDLNYLLGNILSPSDVIQDAYRMSLVLTAEGRFYSGILAGESERHIELRVVGEDQPVVLPKSTILSRETASVSMMPAGLLGQLTDAEVLELVAYLRTAEQVPLPKTGVK